MSKGKRSSDTGALVELWRPPTGSGDPVGCLSTTYTFAPGLFDEQCLARFLGIESEPDREDLAFLLERENRLGGVYAGVLVDHTQAGVEHSLRWDVLPVRIYGGKQHAKLSLLAWAQHVRIIITSANLTEPGYRTNYEVAGVLNLTPMEMNSVFFSEVILFLHQLLALVPGVAGSPPEVLRAKKFLDEVEQRVQDWKPPRGKHTSVRRFVATFPNGGDGAAARSALDESFAVFRKFGGAPSRARVASPFFDVNGNTNAVAGSLTKSLARGGRRQVTFCVPASNEDEANSSVPRLVAPKSLLSTAESYNATVAVETLPDWDADKNRRIWHAKMLELESEKAFGLMVGSSNFTTAGMGVGGYRNVEANLLTIVKKAAFSRDAGRLAAVWPETEAVSDPANAEWLGADSAQDEEERSGGTPLPQGFVRAMYRAGESRSLVFYFEPERLPAHWSISTAGTGVIDLLSASVWAGQGSGATAEVPWESVRPPEKLLVRWDGNEAFFPLNVEDSRQLPPPFLLDRMSAEDMLWILAATDPGAAFRAWARHHQESVTFDDELDSAVPVELDPLKRYDLHSTFLHRIRRRARILAQVRENLERPVWGIRALEWRLSGLIGIDALAGRLASEFCNQVENVDEALLTIADFLIVLREVEYTEAPGALSKHEFKKVFGPFLSALTERLESVVSSRRNEVSENVWDFWKNVVDACRK